MRLFLRRFHQPAAAAEFDPETREFHNFHRTAVETDPSGPAADGLFDQIGLRQTLAAFYRSHAGELEVFVDGQLARIGARTRSSYEPPDPGRLPWKLWGTGRRVFRLYEGGRLTFEYSYAGVSVWLRLIGLENDPDAAPAYDLLFEVDRVLNTPDERDRVFSLRSQRGRQRGSAAF